MKIEVTGSKCISCRAYNQFYQESQDNGFEAIDCGYCWKRHCTTRPGNRCKYYQEKSNMGLAFERRR